MTFDEILVQIIDLLKRQGRVSYRALKMRFNLDDEYLDVLKEELLYVHPVRDDEGRGLVWTGNQETSPPPPVPSTSALPAHPVSDHEREPLSYTPKHLAEKILTSRSALEGERKQVTVLFCDLANSTPIAERLGPEHMHTLLNRFFEFALSEVHRYEGTINQFLGDGFMALFGAPIAHEDHARRAVLAALALQRTLQEADLGKPYGEACQFRMGLNSGLVVVGSIGDKLRMDYSAIGDTTNLAARLQQVAEPGTILVSESTTRLVQGAVRLEALAPVEVKGKTEPVPIYKVVGTLQTHKRLLQTASILGRESAPRLLQALWEETTPLASLLMDLKRLEFLYERTRGEEPVYVFKHALTQEVAYDSLLTTRRQMLHAAAGHAMERLSQEWLMERAEALAHHFTRGEVWEKAFGYLARSGEKARQVYANQEAIAFYTQALAVSQRIIPPVEAAQLLPVYEGRGQVWFLLTKYDEAIADFQHMRQMARTAGAPRQEGESLCHLALAHYYKYSEDHLPLVEQYAQAAQHLAQRLGAPKILAQSRAMLGQVEAWRGNVEEVDRQFAASLQISRREGYQAALVSTLRNLSTQAYVRGNFQPAIHFAQEGVTVARDIHEGFHELYCLAFLGMAQWSWGDYPQAFCVTHEVLTKAHERQNMFFLSRMKNHLGWFYRELGAVSRAIELDHESTDFGRTHGISNVEISALINLGLDYQALHQPAHALSYLEPTFDRVVREAFGSHRWRWQIRLLIGLAEISYTTGDHDQALRYVEEGLKEAQRTSSQKYVALGWALRGKITAKLGDLDTAGTDLQCAFSLAEQLQSPSLLYPIAYDFGQWYESTGKEREAAALYSKAKATTEQMATAVEDEALRSTFLQSALVQAIHERAARLGG